MAALPVAPVTPPAGAPTPYPGNVIQGPWSPVDIAPIGDSEAVAEVTALATESALPVALTVGDAVPAIGVGIIVEESLRNNPTWDHFWKGVGGHIGSLIDSVFHGLTGGDTVYMSDIDIRVGVLRHFQERLIRQLHTKAMAKIIASTAVLARANLANRRLTIANRHAADVQYVRALTHANTLSHGDRAYADARAAQATRAAQQAATDAQRAAEAWSLTNVARPLNTKIDHVGNRLSGLEENLGRMIDTHAAVVAAGGG